MFSQKPIYYFQNPGRENTDDVLKLVKERAEELGIKTIIVASTTGNTAVKATEYLKGYRVIAVSHSAGFLEAHVQKFTDDNRRKTESNGGTILTTTHVFSGLSRGMRIKFNMIMFEEIVANTLRVFGQGMKVVCEIVMMSADAGLVNTIDDVIVIGGTGGGSDTAVVVKPVTSHNFFDMKIREIICKPHF